jgi:hypothetical protein
MGRPRLRGGALPVAAALAGTALASPLVGGPVTRATSMYVWTATRAQVRNLSHCTLAAVTPELRQGRWVRRVTMDLAPGRSGTWRTESAGSGSNEAALRFVTRSCPTPGRDARRVRLHWDNRRFGPDRYDAGGTDAPLAVTASGGSGFHTTVRFLVRD